MGQIEMSQRKRLQDKEDELWAERAARLYEERRYGNAVRDITGLKRERKALEVRVWAEQDRNKRLESKLKAAEHRLWVVADNLEDYITSHETDRQSLWNAIEESGADMDRLVEWQRGE